MPATNAHLPHDFLPPGTCLGRYEIVGRLAIGGMAEIYLARTLGLEGFEKRVVLKRMLPQYATSSGYQAMFLDEARLAARLSHANIVHAYDIGFDGETYFFTMEYVCGEDARRLAKRCWSRGERFPIEHALKIVIDAAAGLHAAHETLDPDGTPAHVVHRDASPSNILVSFDGWVKLIDFGVAKATRRQTETGAGQVKGKVSYMSPEQARGVPVDRRSDVFTLGIVLYELTSNQRLFTGASDYEVLDKIAAAEVPPPSLLLDDYPTRLEDIVLCCLSQDPDDRFQTAQELQLALEELARRQALAISSVRLGEFVRTLFPGKFQRARTTRPDDPPPIEPECDIPSAPTETSIEILEEADDEGELVVEPVDELEPDEEVVDIRSLLASPGNPDEHDQITRPVRAHTARDTDDDPVPTGDPTGFRW